MSVIQKVSINICLTFLFTLLNEIGFTQVFNWYDDGFTYNISDYYNIDNSGIDIQINGITGGASIDNTVDTGINGNGNNGVQHTYTFKFSEVVDVEFEVKRINRDTTGMSCYNDQLIFLDNPQFMTSSQVNIVGDTVFPMWGGTMWSGSVRVRYENIDSLTFLHGEGIGCDPGFVTISPLIINDDILSAEDVSIPEAEIVVIDDKIVLKNQTELPQRIEIYNSIGQSISYRMGMKSNIIIDIQNTEPAFYFIHAQLSNGSILRRKVFLK